MLLFTDMYDSRVRSCASKLWFEFIIYRVYNICSVKVSYNSSSAERLALTEVVKTEVGVPNATKSLQVVLSDGEDLFVDNPVNDIGTRRVGQGAFVVIERTLYLQLLCGDVKCSKEFGEINVVYVSEFFRLKLINKRVALLVDLKKDSDNSEGLLIIGGPVHQFVDNVDLEVVLDSVEAMLGWAMHMHVVYFIKVRTPPV